MTKEFISDLSACRSLNQLATALGVDGKVLTMLCDAQASDFYIHHRIPKKSRHRKAEYREVYEPVSEELRQFHKTVNRRLYLYSKHRDQSFPNAHCFGFVRGRSTLENARKHCGSPSLLRADILDFFPSITKNRVHNILLSISIFPEMAEKLAAMLCFTGSLVAGLSASPLIANLACRSLDEKLYKLASKFGATYTRYADDIAISGATLPPTTQLKKIFESEGFDVSPRKLRITKRGQSHFVTGLSIAEQDRPHVPKMMKRRLRQELYYCKKYSIEDHLIRTNDSPHRGTNRLDGMVRYVSFIEKGTAYDFRARWHSLLARDDIQVTIDPDHNRIHKKFFVAVDESIATVAGRRILALGFALFQDKAEIDRAVDSVMQEYLSDPFTAGKKAEIRKRGLHFVDAHPVLQNAFLHRLPELPFRAYVAFVEIQAGDAQSLSQEYLRLFNWGFVKMCERTDRGSLRFLVEQSSVRKELIQQTISEGYALMCTAGIRRPASLPEVEFVGKESAAISVPDFMLGTLGHYMDSGQGNVSTKKLDFERVRDRFALIFDVDQQKHYSRRKPFII